MTSFTFVLFFLFNCLREKRGDKLQIKKDTGVKKHKHKKPSSSPIKENQFTPERDTMMIKSVFTEVDERERQDE